MPIAHTPMHARAVAHMHPRHPVPPHIHRERIQHLPQARWRGDVELGNVRVADIDAELDARRRDGVQDAREETEGPGGVAGAAPDLGERAAQYEFGGGRGRGGSGGAT